MRENLERDLQAIGLSDKEARVYLAALELGSATAQAIAAKATVSRPNTYVMIESLGKRGLLNEITKGTKRYFTPTAPEKLLEIVSVQRQEVQEKEAKIQRIMPGLLELTLTAKAAPTVRVLDGRDLWTELQEDILASGAVEVADLAAQDGGPVCLRGGLDNQILDKCRVRAVISDSARSIKTAKSRQASEVRVRRPDTRPFPGDLAVYGDRVFLSANAADGVSVIIRDAAIAATLAALFEISWTAASRQ